MSQPTAMTQRPDFFRDRPMPAPACYRRAPGVICSTGSAPVSRQCRKRSGCSVRRRGRVLDPQLQPLAADSPYRHGLQIYYFREVANERPIPFGEQILYQDDHLLVADKPPFLPR